ncbi:PEP-CTERM-box response regulator transcription factor [Thiocapsa imhoffii]|uniref:PEP-CTERM-box response regulator transcription factor n=1 Tax=Thiocapsa imhoffii TaxID=382777 RepID=A0A9X0WIB9_9GAMM|nr:PEP-CTERM-box response regulator transcription factor [Thiocapsa imhoffii]MBK1645286.1 PEP-CTERM-box response regulator transcription factor [Thiocapsa imhoffii]
MDGKHPKRLLIVEDDPGLLRQLSWSFEGFEIAVAADRETALNEVRRFEPDVVTLDLGLPPDPGGTREGFLALQEILTLAPQTKVIVLTGHNDRHNAVRAVGLGAHDFCEKPVDPEVLTLIVERAAHVQRLEEENRRLAERTLSEHSFAGLIAASPQMMQVRRMIEKLAPIDVTTLILGESGTGKEVLVKMLHALSGRAKQRLVAINCAAIPENLLESELFGYEKGAFTGAAKSSPGKIESANGGILFLDEIGDLPQSLQAKLLRFLQERVVERIGGRQEIAVDVRVVCATHQNLVELISEGQFREDLYYRINGATIQVPPLRERQGDALLLAQSFLRRYAESYQRPIKDLTPDAKVVIERYPWPGNVRELENRVKRAVIMADGQYVTPEDLELANNATLPESFDLRTLRERTERDAIQRALQHGENNVSRAAELLGITRPTLYTLLKKYDIST